MNSKTRENLKSFLVNPQVKFEYPVTAIGTPTKSTIILIDLEKLDENAANNEKPFGIIKTDVLLNVINSIPDCEISHTDSDIIIKNDNVEQKIRKI